MIIGRSTVCVLIAVVDRFLLALEDGIRHGVIVADANVQGSATRIDCRRRPDRIAAVKIRQPVVVWHGECLPHDPAGDHDWGISAEIDLAASDEAGVAVLRILDVGPLTA